MQTFLPYSDFLKTAKCLDYKRLGKQRVEAWQIYQCLSGQGSLSWKNHPAVKMWRGYELALLYYGFWISYEWQSRGFKDSMTDRFLKEFTKIGNKYMYMPEWLGNEKFHASHRSNLLRKDKEYYSKFGWKEPDNLPYIWPLGKKILDISEVKSKIASLEEVYRQETNSNYPYERGFNGLREGDY